MPNASKAGPMGRSAPTSRHHVLTASKPHCRVCQHSGRASGLRTRRLTTMPSLASAQLYGLLLLSTKMSTSNAPVQGRPFGYASPRLALFVLPRAEDLVRPRIFGARYSGALLPDI